MGGRWILRMIMAALIMSAAIGNAASAATESAGSAAGEDLWERYKAQFIAADGRVIDFYQEQGSHSEGQGYGLILAAANNDKKAFDAIWRWTKSNLRVRHDALFAWRWGKRATGAWDIIDYNNATDGDVLIAFGLLKGYQKWQDEEYRTAALKTVLDLRTKMSLDFHGKTVLLPSYYGFSVPVGVVLNPSYIVFPAYRLFAAFDDRGFWEKAYRDGFFVISKSYFGEHPLPPDWIIMHENRADIFREKGSLFGFEAIRVILYLAQEKTRQFEKGTNWMFDYFQRTGDLPLWVDLDKNSFSVTRANAGTFASFAAVARRFGKMDVAAKLAEQGRKQLDSEGTHNYYSYSLYLLATSGALEVID